MIRPLSSLVRAGAALLVLCGLSACAVSWETKRIRIEVDDSTPAVVILEGSRPSLEILNQGPGTVLVRRVPFEGESDRIVRAGAATYRAPGPLEVHLLAEPGERAWVRIEARDATKTAVGREEALR